MSEIVHHKRTESESSDHQDENSPKKGNLTRQLSRAHSRELMRQASNIDSEHLEQFVMKRNLARQLSKQYSRQSSTHSSGYLSRQTSENASFDIGYETRQRLPSTDSTDDDIFGHHDQGPRQR